MKNKKKAASKKKLAKAFESKGFYIALLSLIVMVGFSVYARRVQENEAKEVSFDDAAWQEAIEESKIELKGEASELVPVEKEAEAEKSEEKEAEEKKPEVNENGEETLVQAVEASAAAIPAEEDKVFGIRLPCDGKIVAECSVDELVYCGAMDDWRTHNGVDIAANEGEAVKAAAGGVVSEVYEDELLGVVVVLDHGNEISTLYGNLQSYDFIRTGTEVKSGDIIGGIGKPGALEADAEPHLHFELRKNGNYENPMQYLN